ncbi:hypothetical protein PHYBOEH_002176 [Phytophthora boehmeriae]|uniref:Uncharacterized protein n=1 Tax=Phytophthora boehmeriae TaxID=109152 RepID=A0A8T1WXG1_9STRA|nr:hypothetical protein PHYBOEH_002176 [Phytophthora boehmeriae]
MGLEAPSTTESCDDVRASRRFRLSWRLVLLAVGAALFTFVQFTTYTPHFHAHLAKHRILRNLQQQPALRLTFQLKRKAMYVHGASTFDVVATPAPKRSPTDNSVVYNGVASFEEDGDTHEYSLVDGTAYYTHRPGGGNATTLSPTVESGCLPSHFVPPIETVLSAIRDAKTATHHTSSNTVETTCPRGSLMVFPFAGEDFLLCSNGSSSSTVPYGAPRFPGLPWLRDDGFKIFGSDMTIEVTYEPSVPVIPVPRLDPEVVASCGTVPSAEMISPSVSSLVSRSVSEWGHRALRAEEAEFSFSGLIDKLTGNDDSGCACKGKKRVCVFVAGLRSSRDYGLTEDDPTNYFGSKIPDHSPCCSSIKYITLATQLNAWNNAKFQRRLVDLVLQVSDSSDVATGTIKDTIIVAHSMANLVLGGAIASGITSLDPSSTWVGTSGPMEGSMGSNYLYETCDGALTVVVSGLMKLFGGCPPKPGRASLAYQGSNYSNAKLDDDFTAAQAAYSTNISAVLCSKNHTGLATIQAAIYKLAANVVPHKSPFNDGIVEFQSCSMGIPDDQFGSSSKSKFYDTSLNHVDAAFRYGDSLFSDNKRPVKWFECLL